MHSAIKLKKIQEEKPKQTNKAPRTPWITRSWEGSSGGARQQICTQSRAEPLRPGAASVGACVHLSRQGTRVVLKGALFCWKGFFVGHQGHGNYDNSSLPLCEDKLELLLTGPHLTGRLSFSW